MGVAGKILIVDDEAEALENCRRILSRVPYDCLTESDAVQALDVIQRERPGLIFTDLRMPDLDGIEVLMAAKRFDPSVQVVLLTAHATVGPGEGSCDGRETRERENQKVTRALLD